MTVFKPKNKQHLAQLQSDHQAPRFSAIATMYCYVLAPPTADNPTVILREATTDAIITANDARRQWVKKATAKLQAGQLRRMKLYPRCGKGGYIVGWQVSGLCTVEEADIAAPTATIAGTLVKLDKEVRSGYQIWRSLKTGLVPFYFTVWHRKGGARPRGRQFGSVLRVSASYEHEPKPRFVFEGVDAVLEERPKRKDDVKPKKKVERKAA